MSEPVITCPNCHSEIKLTESFKLTLAAPVIEAARKEYEERFAEKDAVVAKLETAVRDQQAQIAKERQSFEAEVTARLDAERQRIAGEENERARRLVETDLRQKDKLLAELEHRRALADLKVREDGLPGHVEV